jgi:hypothetical protein
MSTLETSAPKLTCEPFGIVRGSILMDLVAEGMFTIDKDLTDTVSLNNACVSTRAPRGSAPRQHIYHSRGVILYRRRPMTATAAQG